MFLDRLRATFVLLEGQLLFKVWSCNLGKTNDLCLNINSKLMQYFFGLCTVWNVECKIAEHSIWFIIALPFIFDIVSCTRKRLDGTLQDLQEKLNSKQESVCHYFLSFLCEIWSFVYHYVNVILITIHCRSIWAYNGIFSCEDLIKKHLLLLGACHTRSDVLKVWNYTNELYKCHGGWIARISTDILSKVDDVNFSNVL